MRKAVLGVDLGTTNVKAQLYDESGAMLASASVGYPTAHPRPEWAEQEAGDWWRQTATVIRGALGQAQDVEVAAVAVSSQAPTMLPLDAQGLPLRPGIIWMDRRAAEEADSFSASVGSERYRAWTGGDADPYYLLPKILWLKHHEPAVYRATRVITTTNGYINYRLTGVHAMDDMQAALVTHCYDENAGMWSRELSATADIPLADLLPPPCPAWSIIGGVLPEAARETGLAEGTPVCCGTADGIVAQLESCITRQGHTAVVLGTSAMVLMACDRPRPEGRRLMHARQRFPLPQSPYTLSASVNTAGAALAWHSGLHKESLCLPGEAPLEALSRVGAQAQAGADGLLFLPQLSGERAPLWDPALRGAFIGLTLETGHAEMARAILEGPALAVRHIYEHAKSMGVRPERCFISGGGTASGLWLKIHASALGMPVSVSRRAGGASLGDALLAGYAVGLWHDLSQAMHRFCRIDEVIDPDPAWIRRYDALYPIYCKSLYALQDSMAALNLPTDAKE